MKKPTLLLLLAFFFLTTSPALSDVKGAIKGALGTAAGGSGAGAGGVAAGLKVALAVGTGNAVQTLSKPNGYFGDAAVKILLPQKLQTAAEALKNAGYQKEVDDLILSMNQAGVTRSYKALTDRDNALMPFGRMDSLDLDGCVTGKSLDGMLLKVGQEEAKIRTIPAARPTNLFKNVFAQ